MATMFYIEQATMFYIEHSFQLFGETLSTAGVGDNLHNGLAMTVLWKTKPAVVQPLAVKNKP